MTTLPNTVVNFLAHDSVHQGQFELEGLQDIPRILQQ